MRERAPGLRTRAGDDFLNDDAHRDSPDRAAPQDDDDRFRRNPARRHRLPPPIGAEAALCASPSSGRFGGWRATFAVQQQPDGGVIRLPVPWPPNEPLLGEQRAAAVFRWTAGMLAQVGQTPADVEACLRVAILRSTGASP